MEILSVGQIREFILEKMVAMFEADGADFNEQSLATEVEIMKLLITLLRSITPEFLHYNIFLAQSSQNALQSIVNSQSLGVSVANTIQQNNLIITNLPNQIRGSGQLIQIYPQMFFFLEFFKSVIISDPSKDNAYNLRSCTRLIIHIDKLAHQNTDKREPFCRAYSTLILKAFPVLLKCLNLDISRSKQPNSAA